MSADLAGLRWIRHEAPDLDEVGDDIVLDALEEAWHARSRRPWRDALTNLRDAYPERSIRL